MKTSNEMVGLLNKITLLREKQKIDLQSLKEQTYETYQSIKPVNIIKNSLREVVSSSEIKTDLLKTIVNFATNYVSKKIFPEKKMNPIQKIFNKVLKFFKPINKD
ncbi:hypothetical protein [Flavobacterium sp.]|uniref:hypothetical protein n=1 Tax=Flavobacterium sp. TaxID=239 RepID=UPI003750EF93